MTKIKTDARVLAATNRNLAEMVEKGEFRRDLFYRINIIRFHLPPLRERMEDLPLLIERFIRKMNRLRGRAVAGVGQEAMAILLAHDYPGNIRELENIIEHAFILCNEGEIGIGHLPASLVQLQTDQSAPDRETSIASGVQATEAEMIIDTLRRHGYNRLAAARALGIHKSTLFRKLIKHNISLPGIDGRTSRKKSFQG